MHWTEWIAVVLGALLGAWLTFDGSRAFLAGDYVTPRSGPHAGELGPWSRLVSALGIEPRSPIVKAAHVVLGLLWLASALCLAVQLSAVQTDTPPIIAPWGETGEGGIRPCRAAGEAGSPWAWWGLLACAAATLWYLPFGTVVGLVVMLLLVLVRSGG